MPLLGVLSGRPVVEGDDEFFRKIADTDETTTVTILVEFAARNPIANAGSVVVIRLTTTKLTRSRKRSEERADL